MYPGATYKSRTEAVPLFDQKPVIYLEGFNGYFDLDEVHPIGFGDDTHADAPPNNAAAAPTVATADTPRASPEPAGAPAPEATAARQRVVVVFPGQGAQAKGMGRDLFAAYREQTAAADAVLGYSIETLCLKDPEDQLNQTQYTQPALYVVNALGYRKMQDERNIDADVAAFAGHSLGEYNALLAAGVFDFETGLRLVVERGRLMAKASGGGMAAVVGMQADALRSALDDAGLQSIDLANFNSPSQVVISGPAADVEIAHDALRKHKAIVVPLKVSAAFHSRYMDDARGEFRRFLSDVTFASPRVPVIANATAAAYAPDAIADTLARQIASPVRWDDSIAALLNEDAQTQFVEVGSTMLTRLIGEIRKAKATS
jgi:trans-AT polyketide synthase/acyltransferase/oxidoreductase domain-containing protein